MSFGPDKSASPDSDPHQGSPRMPELDRLDSDGKPREGGKSATAPVPSTYRTATDVEASGKRMRRTVVVSLLWQGSASVVSQLISWLATLVVIRLLSPADYGLAAMAGLSVRFLMLVADVSVGL